MILETFFLVEEKHVMRVQIFQDHHGGGVTSGGTAPRPDCR
jgi:hypothetical protein